MNTVFEVSFTLKQKKNQNEPTLISLYSKINRKKLVLSTREKVKPRDWNFDKQRVREQSSIKGYRRINSKLVQIRRTFEYVIEEMGEEKIEYTAEEVKRRLEVKLKRRAESPKEVCYSLYDYFWLYYKREQRRKDYDTVKVFKTTINHLEKFNPNLDWKDIDMQLYHGFLEYLKDKNMAQNTIGNHMNRIKIMVNNARKEGKTNIKMPEGWKRISEQSEAIALTDEEVNAIYEVEIKKDPYLEIVRDLFVIGCRTGLRSGNYLKIDPEKDVQDDMLRVSAIKGGAIVHIPLHWQVKEILEKYNWELPSVTNQTLNKRIKEVALMAKLNQPFKRQYTKGRRKVTETKKKWQMVTSHTARRSFATQMYLLGISPAQIMLITGHKTLNEFMKYIRIDREQNAKEMGQHPFFKKKKNKSKIKEKKT